MREVHVVNFSGGKDSTAMLFKMLENEYQVDYVLFCDTGVEYPEIYKHIDAVEQRLTKYDLQITKLKAEKQFWYWIYKHKRAKGKYQGMSYGFPSWRNRWCTTNLKVLPARKFEKQLAFSGYKIISYIGYTIDEYHRINKKKLSDKNKEFKYPLIDDFKMTEKDCLRYCYDLGFNWDGLYHYISRVSCWVCPFSKMYEIKYLIKHRPELWEQIKQAEQFIKQSGHPCWKFLPNYSCEELELKFKSSLQNILDFPSN